MPHHPTQSQTPVCCGTSVGMLLTDAQDRYLLLTRARPPVGVAPPAGHALDEHTSYRAAAVEEVAEEVGLTVAAGDLELVYDRHLANRCRRIPHDPPGHHWQVYRAQRWSGQLSPSQTETAGAGWYTPTQLQELADRTAAWARGELVDAAYVTQPGLEPVWCWIAEGLGLITMHPDDLLHVLAVAETPPAAAPQ